jgi:hypothetical protein
LYFASLFVPLPSKSTKIMKYLPIAIAAMLFMGCNDNNRAEDPLADSGRTQRTETLLTNLKQLGDSSVYLFGHHDDTVYGIGWEADYGNDSTIHQRSDVKSVCNDYPALLSFDLGHIELGDERNLDGVPFWNPCWTGIPSAMYWCGATPTTAPTTTLRPIPDSSPRPILSVSIMPSSHSSSAT